MENKKQPWTIFYTLSGKRYVESRQDMSQEQRNIFKKNLELWDVTGIYEVEEDYTDVILHGTELGKRRTHEHYGYKSVSDLANQCGYVPPYSKERSSARQVFIISYMNALPKG